MTDKNPRATTGDNNPPTPMETCAAQFDDVISEAENWADGEPVTSEASMIAVDAVLKEFKGYKSALKKAGAELTTPLHQAHKAATAAVKVYTDDADRIQSCLVNVVAPFKAEQAAKVEAARRAAWEAARAAEREAEALAAKADAGSIDDQRAADEAKQSVIDAQQAASVSQKTKVGGLRKVTRHAVVDMRGLVNWIATNDKDAMADFAEEYARKNGADIPDAIVQTTITKEAF